MTPRRGAVAARSQGFRRKSALREGLELGEARLEIADLLREAGLGARRQPARDVADAADDVGEALAENEADVLAQARPLFPREPALLDEPPDDLLDVLAGVLEPAGERGQRPAETLGARGPAELLRDAGAADALDRSGDGFGRLAARAKQPGQRVGRGDDRHVPGHEGAGEDLHRDVLARVRGDDFHAIALGDRLRKVAEGHETALTRLVELPVAVADDSARIAHGRQYNAARNPCQGEI